MSVPDLTIATRWTRSLCRHATAHGLGNTLAAIKPPQGGDDTPTVQTYPYADAGHLAAFARWLPTLANVIITVTWNEARRLHLLAVGAMDDETVTGVVAVLDGADLELVEANCSTAKGDEIPVDLLLSLVSATAAESCETTALVEAASA